MVKIKCTCMRTHSLFAFHNVPLPEVKMDIMVSVRIPLVSASVSASASASHFFTHIKLSLEPVGGISSNLHGYIVRTSLRVN